MGRFRQWGSILAQATGKPVFVNMHDSGVPTPVDPRVFYPWAEAQPKPDSYKLMGLFRKFIMSERYSRTIIADGAQYHDLDGNPTRPMPLTSIDGATRNLANIEKMKAGNAAKLRVPER